MSALGKSKQKAKVEQAQAITGARVMTNRRLRAIGSQTAFVIANEYCLRHYAVSYTGGTPCRLALPVGLTWIVPVVFTSAGYGIVGNVGMVVIDAYTREVVGATARGDVLAAGSRLAREKRGELDAAFHRAKASR
jgi:hypothetical protein